MSAAIKKLKTAIENTEAILIGAGSGFSTAAGYTYSGERFQRHFADFIEKTAAAFPNEPAAPRIHIH